MIKRGGKKHTRFVFKVENFYLFLKKKKL